MRSRPTWCAERERSLFASRPLRTGASRRCMRCARFERRTRISTLRIDALDETTRPDVERATLRRFAAPSDDDLTVVAGAHLVRYRVVGEIRNGPGVYEARVD